MDPSRLVWKWTGAGLAVLCAALGIAHLLLMRIESPGPGPATDSQTIPALDHGVSNSGALGRPTGKDSPHSATVQPAPEAPGVSPAAGRTQIANSRFKISNREDPGKPGFDQEPRSGRKSPRAGLESKKTPAANSPRSSSIDHRPSSIIDSIRPLGIVEKADGRVQAVIQEGEWTRLVEVGEVLAGHSRVVKVSAEGVEVSRPNSEARIELARAGSPMPGGAKPENVAAPEVSSVPDPASESIVSAERVQARTRPHARRQSMSGQDLPGMQIGEASYHVPPSSRTPIEKPKPGPSLIESAAQAPSPEPEPQAALGRIEHSDGRVVSVVADGKWVKLVPELAASEKDAVRHGVDGRTSDVSGSSPFLANKTGQSATVTSVNAPRTAITPELAPLQAVPQGLGGIPNLEATIQNSVEPIGIVEFQDGRTQTIFGHGDSVKLAEGPASLAETRRVLALISPLRKSGNAPGINAIALPGRPREDEAINPVLAEDEFATRGPPGESESFPTPPEDVARGQPHEDDMVDPSRAPPAMEFTEILGLEPGLPGVGESAEASYEPLQSLEYLPELLLGESFGSPAGSVPKIRPENDVNPLSAVPGEVTVEQYAELMPPLSGDGGHEDAPMVLGFVRWMDGRERLVVAFHGSVILAEEGDTLPEGSAVKRAGPDSSADIARPPMAKLEVQNPAGYPNAVGLHQTLSESNGSRLQTEPRIRDNQKQPRQ